ncbi:MAG: FHA domain-containing protein [Thermosynechococcaceae cyanobacterium]
MQIQLIWTDPKTGQTLQPILALPVTIGRSFGLMPGTLGGKAVSRIVMVNDQVEIYHALLEETDGTVTIKSQGDASLSVNGVSFSAVSLEAGDRIGIGSFDIEFKLPTDADLAAPVPAEPPPAPLPPPTVPQFITVSPPPITPGVAAMGVAAAAASLGDDGLTDGGSNSPAVGVNLSGSWRCDRKVGFLFKRPCERTTQKGCPYCRDGQVRNDPYFHDYELYPGYGRYGQGYWGYDYYRDRDRYRYNRDTRDLDFTEADAASFENENDTDYEMDYGAS